MNDQHSETTVDLALVPPPSLFFQLLSQRFTGVMEVQPPVATPAPYRVHFRGGMPTWTDWPNEGTRLGELAVAQGLVGAATVAAAAGADGRRIGDALVANGVLTQDKLVQLLRLQCARRLLDLFGLSAGSARLVATEDSDPTLIQVNVLELIHRGITARYDATRVRRELGEAWGRVFRASPALERYIDQFKFRSEDGAVLAVLASGADVSAEQLSRMPEASPQRVAQLLAVLWHCQMVDPVETAAPADPVGDPAAFEAELAALEARLAAGEDPTAIFGVAPDADATAIDDAWLRVAGHFDPRRLPADDEALRERCVALCGRLAEGREAARARRQALAEIGGLRLVADGKYARGLALLEEAVALGATGPEVDCAVIWARLQAGQRGDTELRAAEEALARVLAEHADLATGHYYRGLVLASLGKTNDAIAAFRRSMDLDPRMVDAERQLRALKRGERAGAPAPARKVVDHGAPVPLGGGLHAASKHELLTPGYKRLYWIAAIVLLLLVVANVVLRLDVDF